MYTSTKTFTGLPCAHRQWRDDGHCRLVHGYDRTVIMTFGASKLDDKEWVVDFGGLKKVKQWLEEKFDHTLLINEDDPMRSLFEKHDGDLWDLTVMPNVGMEASSKYIFDHVNPMIEEMTEGRCWVVSVECRENVKNSAIYTSERPALTIREVPVNHGIDVVGDENE